jgi:uncharacterized coiled-coil DUF342 family protein
MLSAEEAEKLRDQLLTGWGDTLVALVNERTTELETQLTQERDTIQTLAKRLDALKNHHTRALQDVQEHERVRNEQLAEIGKLRQATSDLRVRNEDLRRARDGLLADLTRVTRERDASVRNGSHAAVADLTRQVEELREQNRRLAAELAQAQASRIERAFHAALAATEGGRGQFDHDDLNFTLEVLENLGWLRDPEVEA